MDLYLIDIYESEVEKLCDSLHYPALYKYGHSNMLITNQFYMCILYDIFMGFIGEL